MNEKLIAGYTAYTNADEYGATTLGDAPGSAESASWVLSAASLGASVAATFDKGC
ncbi:LxmA leader domain family RiPP [Streptomyces sp. Ru73]|uniref:LxmA leader domain family RiPP n=1 Tax=Streptomyces sp. Ru73 TaxID=2080748 RepID=UPI0015E3ED4C|nr:LxmA leader domain family RiPP [Streptomyces sp. Ru73]